MNLADEIRQQIEKCKELKLDVGEINNHLSTLEGLVRNDIEGRMNKAYQRGLEDGKAQAERGCEGCQWEDRRSCEICETCCNKYQNQWTAKQTDNEIKVGDEVYACMPSGKTQPFIIIKIYDEDGVKYYSGINADGNHVQGGLNYIKTGRHFPHVAELLKAMKE